MPRIVLPSEEEFIHEKNFPSNYEIIKNIIIRHPGLRFHELRTETGLANGTLQHHIGELVKSKTINTEYDKSIPRYFSKEISAESRIIIKRLSQNTTSKIIKLLLKKECQTFVQLVKHSKKSAGTVSVYKSMLLKDGIIQGDTHECKYCKDSVNRIKYRLVNPEKVRTLVHEYGKTSLQKTADNLADVFLAIR